MKKTYTRRSNVVVVVAKLRRVPAALLIPMTPLPFPDKPPPVPNANEGDKGLTNTRSFRGEMCVPTIAGLDDMNVRFC